jgi:predicted KAP-like P-loop ATPase
MAGAGLLLGKIATSLFMSLLTEAFIKRLLVVALEQLVKKTETDADDKILKEAKTAWGID